MSSFGAGAEKQQYPLQTDSHQQAPVYFENHPMIPMQIPNTEFILSTTSPGVPIPFPNLAAPPQRTLNLQKTTGSQGNTQSIRVMANEVVAG